LSATAPANVPPSVRTVSCGVVAPLGAADEPGDETSNDSAATLAATKQIRLINLERDTGTQLLWSSVGMVRIGLFRRHIAAK
jgi:hypothetical protein